MTILGLLTHLDYIETIHNSNCIPHIETCYFNFICLILSTLLMSILYVKSIQPILMHMNYKGLISKTTAFKISTFIRSIFGFWWCLTMYHFIKYASYPMIYIEDLFHISHTFNSSYYSTFIAYILIILSIIITIPAIYYAGKESLIPLEHGRLHQGMYNYIRHPQAFGEILFWFGLALYYDSPFLFLFTLYVLIPMYLWWCNEEENDLILRFGDEYLNYRKKTGFWLPKLSMLHIPSEIHEKIWWPKLSKIVYETPF
eukprot:224554_1